MAIDKYEQYNLTRLAEESTKENDFDKAIKKLKKLMKNETQIKCPNCGTSIDVQDILSHQLEEEIKQKYQ